MGSIAAELAALHPVQFGFTGAYAITYTLTVFSATGAQLATDTIIVNAVPEPGSIAMFGASLAGLGLAWRRRRSAMIG
jgi:hypothetical protein